MLKRALSSQEFVNIIDYIMVDLEEHILVNWRYVIGVIELEDVY